MEKKNENNAPAGVAEGGGGCVSKTRIKEEIIKIKIYIYRERERGKQNHAYFMVHCNAVAADRELLLLLPPPLVPPHPRLGLLWRR